MPGIDLRSATKSGDLSKDAESRLYDVTVIPVDQDYQDLRVKFSTFAPGASVAKQKAERYVHERNLSCLQAGGLEYVVSEAILVD